MFLFLSSVSAADDSSLLNDSVSLMSSYDDVQYYSNEDNIQTVLSGNDTELYYKNGTSFKVVLSDYNGSLLANQNIIFTINDINYTRVTDSDGIASITINLQPGIYNISSFYVGNGNYSSFSTVNTVKVFSTISGNDIGKLYKNDTQYYATFINGVGTPLTDTMVTFNINGVFYQRRTNENGIAKLNINLNPGKYVLTATNPNNGEMHSNIITVLSTINGSDIVKYYMNGTQYHVNLLDGAGNPLINANVSFNINGVFYTRITDGNGVAKLNINLGPGKYIITALNSLNNELHSNNIEVLPTISADNLIMNYRDGSRFAAKVLDDEGNPLAGSDVTFNINGVFYTRVTDGDGNAHLNISLNVGKYVITAVNYKGLAVSNSIDIFKCNSTISDSNVHIIAGHDRNYRVVLLGLNNKTIPFAPISFKYNGNSITAVTDENGEASILISNPNEGKYSVEYEFGGNINYYPYKSSNTVTVANSTTVLTGKDLKMIYSDGSAFNVTLTNSSSLPIANETVTFNVCGKSYNRNTDEKGVAGLNINLYPGTYEISYSYCDINSPDYSEGSNTIVVSKIPAYLSTSDLIFVYGDAKAFTATLTNASKSPLEGIDVTFNIAGKSYIRTTNASGVAKLNINLGVGYYDIVTSVDSAVYSAGSKSNHVLVDGSILVAYDITVYPGLSRDFLVTVLDAYNNPIVDADIEFIFNGVSSHVLTDNDGVATFTIGGLSKGDYVIVYKYAERNNAGQSYIFASEKILNSKNTVSDLTQYLSDSQNCQVSDPEIVALAKQLTGKYTNPLDKAKAIFNYVRDTIRYGYYYDTHYGAVGTLHSKTGNCVDQSHLSIALYRACGLPARYVHGTCVFNSGNSYGHVWTQVLIGDTWIASDTINAGNSLGSVLNWNNYNYKLHGYFPYIVF